MQKQSASLKTLVMILVVFLIYGALYLMIGWTQNGLSKVIFGSNDENRSYMVYLLLTQVLGFIPATFLVKYLIKKMNIRWIFMGCFGLAAVVLLLIAFLDKISGANGVDVNVLAVVLFSIFSFTFGFSIAPILPLVTTYIGAAYTGHKQTKILGISTGLYGIGGGIVPLTASSLVYELGSKDFSNVKYFYFIAVGLAVLALLLSLFVDYRHPVQKTMGKIMDKKAANFSILKPLAIVVAMMCGYMITETVGIYMFSGVSNAEAYYPAGATDSVKDEIGVTTQQAFGLFVVVQGLWRAVSGLYVLPKISKPYFILGSFAVLAVGLILALTGNLEPTWGKYVVAVCFGFGYGATWTAIYSYANHIDDRRSSFIGMTVNLISMFSLPITQLVQALLWTNANQAVDNALFYSPLILAMITLAITVSLTIFAIFYIPRFRARNNLDRQGVIKEDPQEKATAALEG